MGRGLLTEQEIEFLKNSPYISDVSATRIIYTNEFKYHFMEEYNSGKGPSQIFREAGLPPEILGSRRIERAAHRWRESYASGSLGRYQDGLIRKRTAIEEQTFQNNPDYYLEQLRLLESKYETALQTQQEQIDLLKKELEEIKNER